MIHAIRRIRDTVSFMLSHDTITHPTVFELLTLCAFICFKDAGCSHAVFEVGLGGRLDATNVIEPAACVITPIDLDHTDILGTTIEEIAREKSGIIKEHVPVFAGFQTIAARRILESQAKEKSAPIAFIEDELDKIETEISLTGTRTRISITGRPISDYTLSMIGEFQAENAGLALLTLSRTFPEVREESIGKGFGSAFLPGRMELVRRSPVVLLDGAHTRLATEKLIRSFTRIFPEKAILIFGAVRGKNYIEMGKILAPHFSTIIISTPLSIRESDPDAIYHFFLTLNKETFIEKKPGQAYARALELSGNNIPILVTGSFYMVSAIKKIIEENGAAIRNMKGCA
jgi:dihydrofolate synthase/folylpolyglutamate synthase